MEWIELTNQEPEIGAICIALVDGEEEGPVTWTADRGFVYDDGHELGWDCSHWRHSDG